MESGEGIERKTPPQVRNRLATWNPVKELKDRIESSAKAVDEYLVWNPVKELKAVLQTEGPPLRIDFCGIR